MLIKYNKPKGLRIKKGTVKCLSGKRINMFYGLDITYNPKNETLLWCPSHNKWCTTEEWKIGPAGTIKDSIYSLKAAIRHLKKQTYLPKGTIFTLQSNFFGYDIEIII